jgi:hypothetical protein
MAKHLLSARRVQTSGKGAYCDGAGLRLRVKAAGARWMNFRRKKHGNLKPKHWRGPQQPKRTPLGELADQWSAKRSGAIRSPMAMCVAPCSSQFIGRHWPIHPREL